MNRRPALFSSLVALSVAIVARGDEPSYDRIAAWFQPDRVGQATLSPDGRHLAYTVHEDGRTVIILSDIDNPSKGSMVKVGEDAVIRNSRDHEKSPMRVPFFRWAAPDRLVFSAEIPGIVDVDVRRTHEPSNVEVVYGVDADGRNLKKLADEDSLALVTTSDPSADDETTLSTSSADGGTLLRQPRVIDFAADEPDTVLVEAVRPAINSGSNDPSLYGRMATGLYKINVRTGQRRRVVERDFNGGVIYDRQGNARVEIWRPIDKREVDFIYLNASKVPAAAKGVDKLLGSGITPENYYGTRTFPVGFDYDPNILYIASNAGRDTYGLYALDLHAGKRTELAVEHPAFDLAGFEPQVPDPALVFDRSRRRLAGVRVTGLEESTQWLDPELIQVQAILDGKFPGRSVRIVEWDDARARYLVQINGGADPGRFYVYQRPEDRVVQFARRAPAIDLDEINAATPFAFDTPEGVHLTGYLTLPRQPLVNPPPLLVYCHGGPWDRDQPGFNRDAQVLAEMGFVVLQVNYRGSAGFGTRHREALREDIGQVPVSDLRAAIAWVTAQHKIDHKRVALLGEGFGGYLALRAAQLYPDEFRCVVAINAPTDLEAWTKRAESWQETVDRQQDARNYSQQTTQFLINFGRQTSGPLAMAPLRVSAFGAQDSLAAPPGPSGADDGSGSTSSTSGDSTDPTAPPPPPPTANLGTIAPPPLPPPNLVNFASEVRRSYFGKDNARLAAISPARHAEQLTAPVLLIQDPYDVSGEAGESSALRSALARVGRPADYYETTGEFTRRLPVASTRVFSRMEDFFNLNLYDFNVKVGVPKVQK